MEYDLQRATKQFEKLIKKLNETHEQTKAGGSTSGTVIVTSPTHGHVKLVKDATVGTITFSCYLKGRKFRESRVGKLRILRKKFVRIQGKFSKGELINLKYDE